MTDNPLQAEIVRQIREAGGWIGFDRFMATALYAPRHGYYGGGQPIFGPGGDFTTAPEMTDLFGAVVARQLAAWLDAWPAGSQPSLYEFGAGSGVLAAAILAALADLGHEAIDYRIVELSGVLRQRQREAIAALAPEALDRVSWLDALPARFDGIVIGNEVLDAMPVRVFECEEERIAEVGVALADDGEGLRWHAQPADPELAGRVRALEAVNGPWPRPYRSELAEQAEAWIRTVGASLGTGAVLLFDYGFGDREFYHPQRATGSLMAHSRHRAHPDVLADPGRQDITAHVPFTTIRQAAESVGLETLGYCAQARFLINAGLLDAFAALPREPLPAWGRVAQAVQKLLSEAEMGELFKVIAFGRGLADDSWAPGFGEGDRSDRL